MRTTNRRSRRTRHPAVAMDVMRPVEAFAAGPTSRRDDPARWLRPMLLMLAMLAMLATTAALAMLLGAATPPGGTSPATAGRGERAS